MTRILTQGALLMGLGIAVALLLSGCGGGSDTSPPAAHHGDHGDHGHGDGGGHHEGTSATQHADHEDHGDDGGPREATPATVPGATTAADDYPLDTCVVLGTKLGSMGEPVVIQHEGRTVKLCCAGCVQTFKANPAKYLAKLDEAIKRERGSSHAEHDH